MFHKIMISCENFAWLSNLAISIFTFGFKKGLKDNPFMHIKSLHGKYTEYQLVFTIHFMFVLQSPKPR